MTDKYNSLTVVLENDTRDDDAECIINAIKMIKGVLSVGGNVSAPGDYMAEERAIRKLRDQLREVLWPLL